MDLDGIKNLVLRFMAPAAVIIGVLGSIVTIAVAASNINKWWLAAFAILLSIILSFVLFLFIDKSSKFRAVNVRRQNLLAIFENTHNTWHMYKRLSDAMHMGIELENAILHTNRIILNLVGNFRKSMLLLHPEHSFHISLKGVSFKSLKRLNEVTGDSYQKEPFLLIDLPLFRDTSEGPTRVEDVIDNLDFDEKTNAAELTNLKQTLFYKCFISKDVVFVDKFSDVQQKYTKKYKSALVAPVVLHGIPFAFVCVGSENVDVFSSEDKQIVATFVDAIAEFVRLERIIDALSRSKKVVVMQDVAGLLEAAKGDKLKVEQLPSGTVEEKKNTDEK